MKKVLLLIWASIMVFHVMAQEPADALRYSWYVPGGSARVKAIGGAMGSLGGDLTAGSVNPAGLAFYKTAEFITGANYRFSNTKSTYFERTEKEKTNKFNWGTTGFVWGSGNGNGNLRSSAFSITYNRTADFNSNILYRGRNTQSSYSQKYLEEINRNNVRDGNSLSTDYPFGSSLAFNTYLIDTIGGSTNGNFRFQSRAANVLANGLLQENRVMSSGGIDDANLSFAGNYRDKLMLGGSVGLSFLHYRREAQFHEEDASAAINEFNYFDVYETLRTSGLGINFKAGMIYKPQESWRLGLAIHSPTFYSLTDNYETSITTDVENARGVLSDYSVDYTDDGPSQFQYSHRTPFRVIGSVSFVLREIEDVRKQKGFLTADVEYVNYKTSAFSPDEESDNSQSTKDYLNQLNRSIDNAYKGAFNFRAGGELKFTTLMVRLGGAYYGNPYKDIQGEKGSRVNLSGGLGYRDKGIFIDLTYVHAINKDVNFAYRLANSPYSSASLRNSGGSVYLTFGFKIG